MTTSSQIAYTAIDENYPVAGQDNNSQGFRDNFAYIKTGLQSAKNELDELLNATSGAARKDGNNDFNGYQVTNAKVRQLYGIVNPLTLTTNTTLDVRDGPYHRFVVSNNLTLTFGQWAPSNFYDRIRLEFQSDSSARTITFATTGGGVIKKQSGFPSPFIVPADTSKYLMVDVWTTRGGTIVFLEYVGEFS